MKATPFIAELVMRHYDHLDPADRIRLLEELALVLPKAQAKVASHTAWVVKNSEAQQLAFKKLFTKGPGK